MKSYRPQLAAFVLALSLSLLSACGSETDLDQMLLWSDRVVGYTDTARQLLLDIHCEECEVHPISLKVTLDRIREMQKLHTAHGEYYRVITANRSADGKTITLDTAARAKLDAIAPRMRDKVTTLEVGLPSDVVNRIAPTTTLLSEAVDTLVRNVSGIRPGRDGVVKIMFSPKQQIQFEQQLAKVRRTDEDIAARIMALASVVEGRQ